MGDDEPIGVTRDDVDEDGMDTGADARGKLEGAEGMSSSGEGASAAKESFGGEHAALQYGWECVRKGVCARGYTHSNPGGNLGGFLFRG